MNTYLMDNIVTIEAVDAESATAKFFWMYNRQPKSIKQI